MLEAPPPAPSHVIARRLLANAANGGEAIVSFARAVFCAVVLLRFLLVGGASSPGGTVRALLELPVLSLAIFGSIAAWLAARRGLFGIRALVGSTVFDAVVCFASLLSTVLCPEVTYTGLLRSPDPAAVIAVVFVTALRLTPWAAWVGTVVNLALLLLLIALDGALNSAQVTYGASEVALLLVFIGIGGVVASFACTVARKMVLRSGEESARMARARWQLGLLLREHHDVRTLLSSAKLRAHLILRHANPEPTGRHARELSEDLSALGEAIENVKVRAWGELATAEGLLAVDVADALQRCAAVIRARFPEVRIEVRIEVGPLPAAAHALIAGGERGMMHVLANLLTNACEGDGASGALRVQVDLTLEPSLRQLQVRIVDDGPGFKAGLLEAERPGGITTKAQGSGLGLLLVATLVEASGGRFRARNTQTGGAQVEITLPAAAASSGA